MLLTVSISTTVVSIVLVLSTSLPVVGVCEARQRLEILWAFMVQKSVGESYSPGDSDGAKEPKGVPPPEDLHKGSPSERAFWRLNLVHTG